METQTITKQAVRQVLVDYWQQYKARPLDTLVAFLLPAIGTILVLFVPSLIVGKLINLFVAQSEISFRIASWYIVLLGILWMLGEIFWRIGMHYLVKIEFRGMRNLIKLSFERLMARDYDFYTNNFVGSVTKKAIALAKNFESFSDTLSFNVVTNIFPILFAVIVLWQYSPWIPIILLASIAVVIGVAVPIIRRRAALVSLRHDAASKLSGRLSDAMSNILAIKSFAKEKREEEIFEIYANDFTKKWKRAADYQNLRFDLVMSPMYVTTNIIGLIAAVFFAQKLTLPPGTVVVVFTYYAQVTRMFWDINRVYRNIESSISESAEFNQLFINPPAIMDSIDASDLILKDASIAFDHVTFTYNEEDETASFLNDFSLSIKGNEKIGLVGPSGGGKTTITKLLLRFIDVQSGAITIDGQDITQVTQSSLRESIAYVPQEPLLFHRTLLENIAYGNETATTEEILQAAKLAHADEFIEKLSHGYETLVGERGIKLSGGQRQRIAIARALLKKSRILVLDEATSALDSESEKYIQQGLWALMKNKTALVIAHRLSTIKHLDRIIVLDQGKIVQDGTHEKLIKQKGIYAKLWSHQSGEFLEE